MQKISLSNLSSVKTLSREELKNTKGGVTAPLGHCGTRSACSTGCADFTDDTEQHGTCSTCCIA